MTLELAKSILPPDQPSVLITPALVNEIVMFITTMSDPSRGGLSTVPMSVPFDLTRKVTEAYDVALKAAQAMKCDERVEPEHGPLDSLPPPS